MAKLRGWVGSMLLMLMHAPEVGAREPADAAITRAVFVEGRLWVLADSTSLSALEPKTKTHVKVPGGAIDICAARGRLRALKCADPTCQSWAVMHREKERWVADVTLPSKGEVPIALSCTATDTAILSDGYLSNITGGKVSRARLSTSPMQGKPAVLTSMHLTAQHVFAGFNAGEWGGGLVRIDRKTGQVSVVEKNTTGELCGGPLNSSCDAVNGIADSPWHADCVAVAVGVQHLRSHGRIVEVCKDEIRTIYSKSLAGGAAASPGGEPWDSVAFFGLSRAGKELIAVGIDGIYRFDGSARTQYTALPQFEEVGNLCVSFALPDVALVLSNVNQRHSLSGAVPLIAPR